MTTDLSARSLIAKIVKLVFLVFIVLKKPLSDPLDYKVAIPLINNNYLTLYLNRFRKKPAISKFDKLFTPNHSFSQSLATETGSVLVYFNSTYPWLAHLVSGLVHKTFLTLFHHCFHFAFHLLPYFKLAL